MERERMNVVIVGGSIAGLMAGLTFKKRGHNVRILEQSLTSKRESHAAGLRVGLQAKEFIAKYDKIKSEYIVDCSGLLLSDKNAKPTRFIKSHTLMSSWDTLYYRLRANFDGLDSEYCLDPPRSEGTGRFVYENGKCVTNVVEENDGLRIDFDDLLSKTTGSIHADLVIAADGSSSRIRQLASADEVNNASAPYAGYVAWRGTVKESEVSEATREAIGKAFFVMRAPPNYILVYTIPGAGGSLVPGERLLNFVWYYQCPSYSPEFREIMTDSNGHTHRTTLPPGSIQPAVWSRQKSYASTVFSPPFIELIHKTPQPFISTVREASASSASHFNGRLLFIGDALASFRPHIAMSVNQAGLNCLLLDEMLAGKIDLKEWERRVESYANKTKALSTLVGNFGMYGIMSGKTLQSALAYIWAVVLSRLSDLWNWRRARL